MQTFQKPENALRRAEEFLAVGQPNDALSVLHSTVSNRKFRSHNWESNSQEEVMMKYVQLCVDLNQLKVAREGLHHYRSMTQVQNAQSLGKVLTEMRNRAEAKLAEAKSTLARSVNPDDLDEDLEAEESPDSLMLSILEVEIVNRDAKEMHAALRMAWECYKVILELIRTIPKLEKVYHETTAKAFEFCQSNQRTAEFHRLCDMLRSHHTLLLKNKTKSESEGLLCPELHLETRMLQLRVAADLKLWRESYQTSEDVFLLGLHELANRYVSAAPKDQVTQKLRGLVLSFVSTYYEKLSAIFWVSDNPMFHALALLKCLNHSRQFRKTLKPEELTLQASLTCLAVMVVPLACSDDALGTASLTDSEGHTTRYLQQLEHQKKLASLLGHPSVPTRDSLKQILLSKGVLNAALPEVKLLFDLFEGELTPLNLCSQCEVLLAALETHEMAPKFAPYIPKLKAVILHKLLLHLSHVYRTVSLDFFITSICPETFLEWSDTEKVIVSLVGQRQMQPRLDYAKRAIYFGNSVSDPENALRNYITDTGNRLSAVLNLIQPNRPQDLLRAQQCGFVRGLRAKVALDAVRQEDRKKAINARRAANEEATKRDEESRRLAERERLRREEADEVQRKALATKKLEEQARREERERIRLEASRQVIAELRRTICSTTATKHALVRGKAVEDVAPEDLLGGTIGLDDVVAAQEEQRNRERQERVRHRRQEAKRVDHWGRAFREQELSMLGHWGKEQATRDESLMEERYQKSLEEDKQAWESSLSARKNFEKVLEYKSVWLQGRMTDRRKQLLSTLSAKKVERAIRRRNKEQLEKRQAEELAVKKAEEQRRKAEEEAARKQQLEEKKRAEAEIAAKAAEEQGKIAAEAARKSFIEEKRKTADVEFAAVKAKQDALMEKKASVAAATSSFRAPLPSPTAEPADEGNWREIPTKKRPPTRVARNT